MLIVKRKGREGGSRGTIPKLDVLDSVMLITKRKGREGAGAQFLN
jgi:hypothetical protein